MKFETCNIESAGRDHIHKIELLTDKQGHLARPLHLPQPLQTHSDIHGILNVRFSIFQLERHERTNGWKDGPKGGQSIV